jgi:hypothetical protein
MNSIRSAVILVALIATACTGVTVSPSAVPSSPPAATASPTAAPSASPPSPLEGTWSTGKTTCAQQQAAMEAADFSAEQLTLADWSPECGAQFTVRFADGRLVQSTDGDVGWDGKYRIVDEETFEAGDRENGCYITYHYAIDGDQLTIDMVEDICPAWTEAELLGDSIVQTEIYETSPFTRQD